MKIFERNKKIDFYLLYVFESGIVQAQDGGKRREISENINSNSSSGK